MDGENPLPHWARQLLIGLGLFLTGAAIAFGYSYRPLHGALTWKVDHLETRLDARNRENVELRDRIAVFESNDENRVDPDTLAQVKRELEQTQRVLQKTEKDLERTDRERREASSNASIWQRRFEDLREATPSAPSLAATRARRAIADPDPGAGSPPASPDPSETEPDDSVSGLGSPLRTGQHPGFEPDDVSPAEP